MIDAFWGNKIADTKIQMRNNCVKIKADIGRLQP